MNIPVRSRKIQKSPIRKIKLLRKFRAARCIPPQNICAFLESIENLSVFVFSREFFLVQ